MKTLILNPKNEEQKHRENSILSLLKEGTRNPRIKFPDYIYFEFNHIEYYKVKVSSMEKTFESSDFKGICIKQLQNYLEKNEPNISFSYSAKWIPKYDTFTLYFESDPESFKAFQNRIPKIRGLKLELKEKQQELNPTDLNISNVLSLSISIFFID